MLRNHNDSPQGTTSLVPDAHGVAALLLVESLIHGLCEHSIMEINHAVEIVERAVDVQYDLAVAADDSGAPLWRAHTLLQSIAASLSIDLDDQQPFPRLVS